MQSAPVQPEAIKKEKRNRERYDRRQKRGLLPYLFFARIMSRANMLACSSGEYRGNERAERPANGASNELGHQASEWRE